VELIAGMLALGVVIGVAAALVVREAGRVAKQPPPALFDPDDAYDWVVDRLPEDAAATLTPDDVRRILGFEVEFLAQKGVTGNGSPSQSPGPLIFGVAETVVYILERAAASGESYIPEQVQAVVETQLSYLESIGAIGPPAPRPGSL
jgi:hypothetical protein